MISYRRLLTASVMLTLVGSGVAMAQDDGPPVGHTIEVVGVEYAYAGLPSSVPVGSSLTFTNAGAEVHELALFRVGDDVTMSLDELLMLEDPVAMGLAEMASELPLLAGAGSVAEGALTIERAGRYVAVCLIPQGLTDASLFDGLEPDDDLADLPIELQELYLTKPPHALLGMVVEFEVTPSDGPIAGGGETAADG